MDRPSKAIATDEELLVSALRATEADQRAMKVANLSGKLPNELPDELSDVMEAMSVAESSPAACGQATGHGLEIRLNSGCIHLLHLD